MGLSDPVLFTLHIHMGEVMVVRVVKEEPHPIVVKEVVCANCGVTLEYTPNDVQRHEDTGLSCGPNCATWVECPKCSEKAVIARWQEETSGGEEEG